MAVILDIVLASMETARMLITYPWIENQTSFYTIKPKSAHKNHQRLYLLTSPFYFSV